MYFNHSNFSFVSDILQISLWSSPESSQILPWQLEDNSGILSPSKYIMRNAGLVEAQPGIKIPGRNIKNLRYADGTALMAESEEELKSLLMKVKEESEKVVLKLSIRKLRSWHSDRITSWEIDGETMETVIDLFSWALKSLQMVTAAMKLRHLLLGRKAMTNLDSILKSRDITLPKKVHLVKAMVFPVVTCMDVRVGL